MDKKMGDSHMLIPTLIMGVIAVVLFVVGYCRGQHMVGIKSACKMGIEILPILFFAFIVAGMIQVLLPQELMAKWIGGESGMKGVFIGTVAGALSPGGPYVTFPIAAGFMRAGASVGTIVAFLAGWSLWSLLRLPIEVGILGWRLTMIHFMSVFVFPPMAGFIALFLSKIIK